MRNLSVSASCTAIRSLIRRSCLKPTYQFKRRETLFFAGQMTGVEGYVESAASGLIAGINAGRLARGLEPLVFPADTTLGQHGALYHDGGFQAFSADEREFRLVSAAGETHSQQERKE